MQSHPPHSHHLPQQLADATDPILRRALDFYHQKSGFGESILAQKARLLEYHDVPNIRNATALCHWGRSGSILLASYLDGHDDVITLPNLAGELIYPFYDHYAALSVWDKLIVYPIYSAAGQGWGRRLFSHR